MTNSEEIRKEIVNNERRLRNILSEEGSENAPKVAEIRSRIVNLKYELLQLEKNIAPVSKSNELTGQTDSSIANFIAKLNVANNDMLNSRYSERYSSACYYKRPKFSNYLNEFMASQNTVMALTGKAGSGKSVFVCNIVDAPPENVIVVLQDSTQVKIDNQDVDSYLGQVLQKEGGILNFLEHILDLSPLQKILIIFDSINEHPNREVLIVKISDFINKIEDPRIKVLITCRVPIWHSIKRFLSVPSSRVYHLAGPDSYVEIDSFSEKEVMHAYNTYKSVYKLKTDYEHLSEQVKYFISNPLFLKMTAEVYGGRQQKIPYDLALRDVFSDYVLSCLGEKGYESEEYTVLQRVIELMYEKAKKELELGVLQQDGKIGQYVSPNYVTPFSKLVEDGLLSQKFEISIIKKIEKIYVTYERIFEFLLAEFIIGDVSLEKILQNLELAQSKSFIQLRGAIELALSFSILHNKTDANILLELSRVNKPESRQYLLDVIQTIYDSGHREVAENIITDISQEDLLEAKILAVQASFQLGLEHRLISLSLADDEQLRAISTLFLYERWNHYRKHRDLDKGYQVLRDLSSEVNIIYPQKSVKVFQNLASITGYMFIHVVDEPKSVYPVFDFYKELLYKVPGTRLLGSQGKIGLLSRATDVVIESFASSWARIGKSDQKLKDLLEKPDSIRALLDIGELTVKESLLDYKDPIIRLITWDNPIVSYFAGSLITHQIYFSPELDQHISLFGEIFLSDRLKTVHRVFVIRAFIVGFIARLLRDKDIPNKIEEEIFDSLVSLWNDIQHENPEMIYDPDDVHTPFYVWKAALFGLLYLEALLQRRSGNITGSNFLKRMLHDATFTTPESIKVMIEVLEKIAYQGFVDFSISSMLNKEFYLHWKKEDNYNAALLAFSNCRGLYQKEVDSIFKGHEDFYAIWEHVRLNSSFPKERYFRDISNHLWGQAFIALDMEVEKSAGVLFLELADSKTTKECMRRMIKAYFDILDEPIRQDIAHYQWGLAHDKEMKRFNKLNLPKGIENIRPDLHAYYKGVTDKIVGRYGLGMLHEPQ